MNNIIFLAVFTIHSMLPASIPPNTKVYFLDDIAILQNQLNTEVKNTYELGGEQAAEKAAKDFIAKHKQQYLQGLAAISKAQIYGITRIPAVVINDKYQILGTTNPATALKVFNRRDIR
jgi:integrating conjugative element protein (TIGR03757 family)